jgi:methionyl-tRNA formyltransferase
MTHRGCRFLEVLRTLRPDDEIDVITWHEDPWEPPFRSRLREMCDALRSSYREAQTLDSQEIWQLAQAAPPDLLLMVSWRYLVSDRVLHLPRLGSFVFHDSLLPAYRGFAPTCWAIINGESLSGVTLLKATEDFDAGPIVAQSAVQIGPDETIGELYPRVTEAYVSLLEGNLANLLEGRSRLIEQEHARATYCGRRMPSDNRISWTGSAAQVFNLVRAVGRPYPGAWTTVGGQRLTVWGASRLPEYREYVGRVPGAVVEVRPGSGAVVLTGDGAVLLTEIQIEGSDATPADRVLNSLSLRLGS